MVCLISCLFLYFDQRKLLPGINMKSVSEKYNEEDFLAVMQVQ